MEGLTGAAPPPPHRLQRFNKIGGGGTGGMVYVTVHKKYMTVSQIIFHNDTLYSAKEI